MASRKAEKTKRDIYIRKMRDRKVRPFLDQSGWRCVYCGTNLDVESIWIDHVIPRSAGGETNQNNCVASCQSCNMTKTVRTIEEFRFVCIKKKYGIPSFTKKQIKWLMKEGFDFEKVVYSKEDFKFHFEKD